jgi:hypothetical protein
MLTRPRSADRYFTLVRVARHRAHDSQLDVRVRRRWALFSQIVGVGALINCAWVAETMTNGDPGTLKELAQRWEVLADSAEELQLMEKAEPLLG